MDDMGTSQKWSSFFSTSDADVSWPDSCFSDQFDPIGFDRNDDQDDKLYNQYGLEGIGQLSGAATSPAADKVSVVAVPSASSSSEDTTPPGNPTGTSVKSTAAAPS